MRQLVNKKQRALLLHSEVTKRYRKFLELLLTGMEITDVNIASFDQEVQIIVQNMLANILDEARNEWSNGAKYKKFPKSANMRCSICRTRIQHVYFINNSKTGEQLQVGRECVKQFVDPKNIQFAERNERLFYLNEQIRGIESIIQDWSKAMIREVTLTKQYEVPHIQLHSKIKGLFNDYLGGKIDEKACHAIREVLAERQQILAAVDEYIETNKDKEWIATRKIYNWLSERHETQVINRIRDTGFVTEDIAARVAEPEFMDFVADRVNQLLTKFNIRLTPVTEKRGYLFPSRPLPKATLLVSHADLFNKVGPRIYNKLPITREEIMDIVKPADDISYDLILQELLAQLRRVGIRYYKSDLQFNEVIFYNPDTKLYYQVAFKIFVQRYVKDLFLGSLQLNAIKGFILDYGSKLSREQAKDKERIWEGKI